MFTHLAIHHPRPEYAGEVLASMHRVIAAAEGCPGLLGMEAARADDGERLLALARWEGRAAYEAAAPRIFAVVADDPFDLWCLRGPEVIRAESA